MNNRVDDHELWLPYTQMQNHLPQLDVDYARGSKIFLKNGEVLIDGISSWWSAAHGYSHPHIIEAMQSQLLKLPHIMLAGMQSEQTSRLAKRLTKKTGLYSCFFSDSGSVAIEVAMKIAWQYFENIGQKNKKKFLSFKDSYHGDTTGAMSLADLEGSMHSKYKGVLIDNCNVDIPENEDDLNQFEDFVKKNSHEIAALFIEPIVRCAGGMKFSNPEIYAKIAKIVKKYDILLVVDECAVGFYRLGTDFAYNICNIKPDIVAVGKALTGGAISLAATIVSEEIFRSFLGSDLSKALMHGPTFMGNALACAAGNASLDLFEEIDYAGKVTLIEEKFKADLSLLSSKYERVKDVRVRGALAAIETEFVQKDMFELRKKFVQEGVFLRPFIGVIYVMPALNIAIDELSKINDSIDSVLSKMS